jgi:hypothetical protein
VHRPVPDHPKVPEWEQLAATTGMVTTLSLLLHSHGWASIWRTGAAVHAPQVRKYLGVADEERLLGWLYVGTRCTSAPPLNGDRSTPPQRSPGPTVPTAEPPPARGHHRPEPTAPAGAKRTTAKGRSCATSSRSKHMGDPCA